MHLLSDKPSYKSLKAVKSGHVYVADGNQYFNRPVRGRGIAGNHGGNPASDRSLTSGTRERLDCHSNADQAVAAS